MCYRALWHSPTQHLLQISICMNTALHKGMEYQDSRHDALYVRRCSKDRILQDMHLAISASA